MRRPLRFMGDDRGLAAVEYALLIALIGLVIAFAAVAIGEYVVQHMDAKTTDLNP